MLTVVPRIGARIERRRAGVARWGTVHYSDQLQALVKWDNGTSSSLRLDRDRFTVLDDDEIRVHSSSRRPGSRPS